MRKTLAIAAAALLLSACSDPKQIVLGPEPLKTVEEKGEQIRKLPEEERKLLVGYLMANQFATKLGGAADNVTGRTVGEVLTSATKWKAEQEAKAAEAKKREAEAAALAEKVKAEQKAVADRIAQAVTVAVTAKRILPENMQAHRFEDQLAIQYALENRSTKDIRLLKGKMHFIDAAGDEIGWLPLTFDERIGAGKTLTTDTGRIWRLSSFGPNEIKKIAHAPMDGLKTRFEAESVAFADGEVIKAPE